MHACMHASRPRDLTDGTASSRSREQLLRMLSAFEMDGFVDFLPWIWGDLRVQYTAKLIASLKPAERQRLGAMVAEQVACHACVHACIEAT